MRSLCLIAISLLGLAACSPPFSTVGFQKKIDIPLNNGRVATALGLGDLDGDHDQDILITSNQNELIALISKGDGSFATGVSYPLDTIGNQNARTIAVGDLTGDGLADVVVGNTEQSTISHVPRCEALSSRTAPTHWKRRRGSCTALSPRTSRWC